MNWRYQVDHRVRSLDEVVELAEDLVRRHGPYKVCVATAEDVSGLGGLALGSERGLVEPILIGHRRRIREALEKIGVSRPGWRLIVEKDNPLATHRAARMVLSGRADILMRGKLLAREFLKALLEPKLKVKKPGALWSNVVVISIDRLDRLLFLTDCAVVVKTDLAGRLRLIGNVLDFAALLGVREPKVALLAAVESVSPGMPVSLEEAVIAKMSERGQFPRGTQVDGPLSLDLAINPESVKKKGLTSPVAGNADILVLNNIGIGNILFKSMITLCGARSASVVVGMPFPTVLTSRSEKPENIIYSLALAILMAGPKD